MAYFFEVLLAEEDPTKLAAMAQSLPEPPDFDDEIAEPAPVAVETPEVTPVARYGPNKGDAASNSGIAAITSSMSGASP